MNLSFPKIRKGSPKDVVTAYLGLIMKEKRRPRVSPTTSNSFLFPFTAVK
jgi:hypothetical protein